MKRVLTALVVLAVLGSTTGAQIETEMSDWPQSRHDAGRTGYNPAASAKV